MPKAMTPGVMSEHGLGDGRMKASSEPASTNGIGGSGRSHLSATSANNNNNSKAGKDRAVSVGNVDGSGGNGAGGVGGLRGGDLERKGFNSIVKLEKGAGNAQGLGGGGSGGGTGKEGNSNNADEDDSSEDDDGDDDGGLDMSILAPALPQITQGFYPLRILVSRLTQESHTMLRDLVNQLQEAKEMDRRMKLIEHVIERRQQFIKLLVLATWARRAEEVSRVIDVKAWFDQIEQFFIRASFDTFALRRDLSNAKVPNPDLKTAIEVLSTGRAPSVPSYGYVPPPLLTAKELLKLLRNVNTILSIRFNLHDTLPPHFRDYHIHDGRATFTVKDEFEVDVTVATDDPDTQLFCIDFRLIFEPALKELPNSRFRMEMETRANEILRTKGLEGLYDFLHDFVMTHKIMMLRRQAAEMLLGRWTETIHISMHKRTLFLHYWTNRPDVKNWIEVGVMRPRGKEPSRLGVRWYRDSKEVKDVAVPIKSGVVSAEELIMTVTALHTKSILTAARDMLVTHPLFPPSSLNLVTSDTDSLESYLKVQLTPTRPLTVQIEPTTGRFALQKQSVLTSQAERAMNMAKPDDRNVIVQQILRAKFTCMQEEIESRARSLGWEILKLMTMDMSIIKQWFGSSTRYLIYMRRKSWRKNWIAVVVLGDNGESWWVAEIQELPKGYLMPDVQRIPVLGNPIISYQFLDNLERMASAIISLYVNARTLTARNVQFTLRPSVSSDPAVRIPDVLVRFDALMKNAWGMNVLKIGFHGLSTDGYAKVIVQGRAKEPMTQLNYTTFQASDTDVAFHPQTGGFALRFIVPVGDSVIDQVIERLHRIERLIGFVTVIRRYNLACHHVSLGRIAFSYGPPLAGGKPDPRTSADVTFSGDRDMRLNLPPESAHKRIKHFLEQQLNDCGLDVVVMNLAITQGLLTALEEVEREQGEGGGELFVLARSTEWFRMDYPRRGHVIDIQLKTRKSQFWWHVKDAALAAMGSGGPGGAGAGGGPGGAGGHGGPGSGLVLPVIGAAGMGRVPAMQLAPLWNEVSVKGSSPLKTGLAAPLTGVGAVVRRIHALIMAGPGGGAAGAGGIGQQQQQQQQQGVGSMTATLVLPMGASGPVG